MARCPGLKDSSLIPPWPPVDPPISDSDPANHFGRDLTLGWETYPVDKSRVLLPWTILPAAIMTGASLLVLRRRRPIWRTKAQGWFSRPNPSKGEDITVITRQCDL
jgi:hypothetical protein